MMSPARDNPPGEDADSKPVILVAEDEVLVRMVIADHLRDCGYTVIEAGNARDAISLFEAAVHVDVVFSDVQMPGDLDGFGLARWLRANRPEVDVLLTSGVWKAADVAAELSEDRPLLPKPYEPEDVERRIGLFVAAQKQSQSKA